jgi:hypothetical protein
MRTVFETDLSTNTVWYLGYPSGDRHQTGNEMMEEKLGRESLVELVYVHVQWHLPVSEACLS